MNQQNHQYSQQMKKATNSPNLQNNKSKVKHKAKHKSKKFNPLQYLNSLIDQLHDQRFQTVRKKSNSLSRSQRASALAYVTPISERTFSPSKPRSKSSFSQHRKKSTMKDILKIQLSKAITEEDNMINFTEETAHNQIQDSINLLPHRSVLSAVTAAKRIQRAWRRFKTLRMLKKYESLDGSLLSNNKSRDKEADVYIKKLESNTKDFERTLKIKKNHINQYSPLQHNSQNTTKELFRYPLPQALESMPTVQLPLPRSGAFQSPFFLTKQQKKVMELFQNGRESSIKLQEQIERRIRKELSGSSISYEDYVCESKEDHSLENRPEKSQFTIKEHSHPLFQEMQKTILQKYQLFKQQIQLQTQKQPTEQASQSLSQNLQQYQGRMKRQLRALFKCKDDYERSQHQLKHKMIQLHINNTLVDKMKIKCNLKVRRVDNAIRKCYSAESFIIGSILEDINIKHIDVSMVVDKRFSVFTLSGDNSNKDKHKNKGEYKNDDPHLLICPTSPPSGLTRYTRTHNPALQAGYKEPTTFQQYIKPCQKEEQSPSFRDDTSLVHDQRSVELYDGAEDVDKDLDGSNINQQMVVVDEQDSGRMAIDLRSQSDNGQSDMVLESQQGISVVKQCCQELQEIIQNNLIDEIAEQIFLNSHIYTSFKVYIEKPFTFKAIADHEIQHFINRQLTMFQPEPQLIHQKINQKINPTSLEILRLIRDYDFQIDQYELILPQAIFKAYRNHVELVYASKVILPNQNQYKQKTLIQSKREDYKSQQQYKKDSLSKLILEKQYQKKIRKAKFYSFQRDLKIMYMKAVFNSLNELIMEIKSFRSFMNARSSIGPGQLTLAIKQYNLQGSEDDALAIMTEAKGKVLDLIKFKCMLPVFKNIKELELFQRQINLQIDMQFKEFQYKWVNYMDEVLQLWQELCLILIQDLIFQAVDEIFSIS